MANLFTLKFCIVASWLLSFGCNTGIAISAATTGGTGDTDTDSSFDIDTDSDLSGDAVVFKNPPEEMISSNLITYEIDYSATTEREIVFELKNPEGKHLGETTETVQTGTGTETMTIDLGTYTPVPRDGYQIVATIRPLGGDSSTSFDMDDDTVKFIPNDSPSGPPAAPEGMQWEVVPLLSDEFNENELDTGKWLDYHAGGWDGREPSQYNTDNVSVSDGMLQLLSSVRYKNQEGNWIWSACVSSKDRSVVRGVGTYNEASIRGSDISMTSSYWFQGSQSGINVTENFGHTTNTSDYYVGQRSRMLSSTHSYSEGWDNDITTPVQANLPTESDHRFYTFGVYWKDEYTVEFYLDGELVNTVTTGEPFNEPHFLYFDTETFSSQGLPTVEELQDPDRNVMYVNWQHSYKLVNAK